jgi:hypothetical protein
MEFNSNNPNGVLGSVLDNSLLPLDSDEESVCVIIKTLIIEKIV